MRVISAKPAKTVEKRVTCGECGARLAYVPNDVKHGQYSATGHLESWSYVVCGHCGKKVEVSP